MKHTYILPLTVLALTACNSEPDYDATGIFEATTVTVAAESTGKILSFDIAEGDSIIAGERVAVIDTAVLMLQQRQIAMQQRSAESSSPDIAAQASSLRSQIAHQQEECDRQGRLLAAGATTQKRHDDAQAALRTLRTNNAPTYLMYYQKDRDYALANFEKLVFKDVSEAGGYGVFFGRDLDSKKKADFIDLMKAEPRRFIAQEIIDFIDLPIIDNGQEVLRKADLRAFVLSGSDTKVWPSGLTRFSRNPDSFVVNSSQGGGFKDTWVLSR